MDLNLNGFKGVLTNAQEELKKTAEELTAKSERVIDFGPGNPQVRHVDIGGVSKKWWGGVYVETSKGHYRIKGLSLEDAKSKIRGF